MSFFFRYCNKIRSKEDGFDAVNLEKLRSERRCHRFSFGVVLECHGGIGQDLGAGQEFQRVGIGGRLSLDEHGPDRRVHLQRQASCCIETEQGLVS